MELFDEKTSERFAQAKVAPVLQAVERFSQRTVELGARPQRQVRRRILAAALASPGILDGFSAMGTNR
jgi:hypothetical protein